MSDQEFEQLRDIIYERAGISFQTSKKYVLESRLARRLEELQMESFTEYVAFLTMGPYQMEEFQEMFNRITINETSFFRNSPQLDVFENVVLPQVLEANQSTKRLRVWSAACSSGEEPYTMAIQIHRTLGVRLSDWRVEILGTDISEKVLLQAATGEYSSFSFRSVDPLITQRYFKESGGVYTLDPTIKQMVNFETLNLKDTMAARRHGRWDVIFCRNVMIYFDDDMRQRVVSMFNEQLNDHGTLFIGHSESLRGMDVPLEPMPVPQAFAYTKSTGKTGG
ncbi:MAG: protein-glutamate O-methyltransferase CheR [Planctomycetota bacterium]